MNGTRTNRKSSQDPIAQGDQGSALRRMWIIGAGEICYAGLQSTLSAIEPGAEIIQLPVDAVTDSLKVATPGDLYILCSCVLQEELIPLCMQIRAEYPEASLLLWAHDGQLSAGDVLRSGASAYLCSCSQSEFTQALAALREGYQYFDMQYIQESSLEGRELYLSQLTPRQEQIRKLACLGLSYKEIGDYLSISPHTVRSHLRTIFEISGVRKRTELIALMANSTMLVDMSNSRHSC